MIRVKSDPSDYYQVRYESNGYKITKLPYAFLIWKNGEMVKATPTLQEAVDCTKQ